MREKKRKKKNRLPRTYQDFVFYMFITVKIISTRWF
jgi:hypothetical protein